MQSVITKSALAVELSLLARASKAFYALIDLANCEDSAAVLGQISGVDAACVLGDLRHEAQLASPWVVQLDERSMSESVWLRLAHLALHRSCMTWISTELGLDDLRPRLRARTEAELPDQHAVLLRYFDPRVLPVLHETLRDEQAEVFFSICSAWHFVSRMGQVQTLSAFTTDKDSFQAPLKLDESQFALMLRAAEVDAIIPELVRESPDSFLPLAPPERIAFVQQCLEYADEVGIQSHANRVLWCLATLEMGDEFIRGPVWTPLARSVSKGELSMAQALQKAT
jgi:hypothetical protein